MHPKILSHIGFSKPPKLTQCSICCPDSIITYTYTSCAQAAWQKGAFSLAGAYLSACTPSAYLGILQLLWHILVERHGLWKQVPSPHLLGMQIFVVFLPALPGPCSKQRVHTRRPKSSVAALRNLRRKLSTTHTQHHKLNQTTVSHGTLDCSMHPRRLRGGNPGKNLH